MEHFGHDMGVQRQRGVQRRALHDRRRRVPGAVRLGAHRSDDPRAGADLRSSRLARAEGRRARGLHRARQGVAHLAATFQVLLVDEARRER